MVTRRRVLGAGLTTAVAVTGTAAALRPMLSAPQPAGADATGSRAGGSRYGTAALFDETYKGRRIQGFGDAHPGDDADGAGGAGAVAILVDGRPLHVMRRADGSWISMANHYQPYPTPLATARGAVDVLGRARLAPSAG